MDCVECEFCLSWCAVQFYSENDLHLCFVPSLFLPTWQWMSAIIFIYLGVQFTFKRNLSSSQIACCAYEPLCFVLLLPTWRWLFVDWQCRFNTSRTCSRLETLLVRWYCRTDLAFASAILGIYIFFSLFDVVRLWMPNATYVQRITKYFWRDASVLASGAWTCDWQIYMSLSLQSCTKRRCWGKHACHVCNWRITNNTPPTYLPISIMITQWPIPTQPHRNSLSDLASPQHLNTYINTHSTIAHTRARAPQAVRSLLASGIKPDAERSDDGVSVFWCRLS